MTRRCWVYINGQSYEKGTEPDYPAHGSSVGPTILPDLPDFVSPIDRTVVRGRTGMRDHCARHNVVPTQELKGLPFKKPEVRASKGEIREAIIKTMHQLGHMK
jgi:hypothetical protein